MEFVDLGCSKRFHSSVNNFRHEELGGRHNVVSARDVIWALHFLLKSSRFSALWRPVKLTSIAGCPFIFVRA